MFVRVQISGIKNSCWRNEFKACVENLKLAQSFSLSFSEWWVWKNVEFPLRLHSPLERQVCEIVNRDEWVWSDNIWSLYRTRTHADPRSTGVLPRGEATHCCKLEFVFRVAVALASRTHAAPRRKNKNTDLFFCWFSFSLHWAKEKEGGLMKLERADMRWMRAAVLKFQKFVHLEGRMKETASASRIWHSV